MNKRYGIILTSVLTAMMLVIAGCGASTKEDVKDGFKAGLIFYNPVNRKVIAKYSGRVKLGGSVKPIHPNLLKILPKILKKIKNNHPSMKKYT